MRPSNTTPRAVSGSPEGDPAPGELFRRWSLELLAALTQGDGSVSGAAERFLVERFERDLGELKDQLQNELPAWREAALHLERLTECRLLPLPDTVLRLQGQLAARTTQAAHLLACLEAAPLSAAPPPAPPTLLPADPPPAPPVSPVPPAPEPVPVPPQKEPPARAARSPGDPRAAAHCRRGDACRQRGEGERALEEYAAALRFDPRHAPAHLGRGRVHRLQGEAAQALAEFDAAARIDPLDPEVYRLRGPARLAYGDMAGAIEDFDAALRLAPGCPTTRFRRAAALRLHGQPAAALAELSRLIAQRPDQAVLYHQRGLAHLDDGDREHALADFTRATRLNPGFKEAHEKLHALLARTTPDGTAPDGTAQTAATSDTRPENSVRVVCPGCGAEGNVRWDRLGRSLTCRACSRSFRVDSNGRLTVVVRSAPRRTVRLRHAAWALPVAAALLLALGLWTWRARAARPVLPELPRSLQERAELLARAWQKKDVPLMRRLTTTTHDRILYGWFVRNPPPPASGGGEQNEPLTVQVVRRKDRLAQVLVRNSPSRSGRRPVEMRLAWERRGETWYFVPAVR